MQNVTERLTLATDKVAHWNSKRDHAQSMLTKWQARLSTLQAKGKPQPTAKKLPPLVLVPGTEHLMPRPAITSKGDQAQAEYLAREAAMHDIAKAADDDGKLTSIKQAKAKPGKSSKPKNK